MASLTVRSRLNNCQWPLFFPPFQNLMLPKKMTSSRCYKPFCVLALDHMQSTAHIMRPGCKRKIFFKIYPCVQVKILRVRPGRIWREQHSCIRRLGSNFSLEFCAKRNNFPDLDKSFALLFLAKYEAEKGTSGCLAPAAVAEA